MTTFKKTSGLFTSFLLGGAVGGAIALMFAPKSGKKLRNDISRKTNELIEEGRNKTYETWNGAKEKAGNTIDRANDFLNTGVEKIAGKTKKVKAGLESGFNAFNDERNSGDIQTDSFRENANGHIM
jgi:gas vesicle protein